jgi:hypothetical protein
MVLSIRRALSDQGLLLAMMQAAVDPRTPDSETMGLRMMCLALSMRFRRMGVSSSRGFRTVSTTSWTWLLVSTPKMEPELMMEPEKVEPKPEPEMETTGPEALSLSRTPKLEWESEIETVEPEVTPLELEPEPEMKPEIDQAMEPEPDMKPEVDPEMEQLVLPGPVPDEMEPEPPEDMEPEPEEIPTRWNHRR